MARSRASRKEAFCGVSRVMGVDREMWRGSWAPRSLSSRVWRAGPGSVGLGGARNSLVERMKLRRVWSSVEEGYPRAR